MKGIYISELKNSPAVFFNTGLDPRSFARTKMPQNMTEEGYVVHPGGSWETWKSLRADEFDGVMQIWGPLFSGKRLDLLINEKNFADDSSRQAQEEALQAVICWIKAKMFLGETRSASNPAASFISDEGGVFFGPEHLSNRCLFSEITGYDRYNCPDLKGMEAAAFCAGAMLYTILIKNNPYPNSTIFQDMREGVFMPVHLASPTLDENLSSIIQSALLLPAAEEKKPKMKALDILTDILKILAGTGGKTVPVSSLYKPLSEEKSLQTEKEKKRWMLKYDVVIKTKRFSVQNKGLLIGAVTGLVIVIIVIFSIAEGIALRPTTEGMLPDAVIRSYYDAFSSLDFALMEACIHGANKADVNAALSLTAILKTRQVYEGPVANIFPAQAWRENGGDLPSPDVFGVTDLSLALISGSEYENIFIYRADYTLWPLGENIVYKRSDMLTLKPDRKNNWRITEIVRTER